MNIIEVNVVCKGRDVWCKRIIKNKMCVTWRGFSTWDYCWKTLVNFSNNRYKEIHLFHTY